MYIIYKHKIIRQNIKNTKLYANVNLYDKIMWKSCAKYIYIIRFYT